MANILEKIVQEKRREVAELPPLRRPLDQTEDLAAWRAGRRPFQEALRRPLSDAPLGLIAEIKKASPSAGVICSDFDPVRIAKAYEAAGASCLSVLTDSRFFQGALSDLQRVREAVALPLLRKDFIIDERQIKESAEWGADAILLIVACLSDTDLLHLHGLAKEFGLAALVEVHDEEELERAVRVGASLIGVNNRDLKTFKVDLATTERLALRLKEFPQGSEAFLVAESGIRQHSDVRRLADTGASAILVGESLMRETRSLEEQVKALLIGD